MNLPRWSLRYPVTAGMVLLSIILLGMIASPRLPLAFLPEVDFPGLEINIPYPNALPTQVEEQITRPAEEALATLSRVRRIQSQSSSTGANISVQFDWGEDISPLRAEAREKLDRIRDLLPEDIDQIQVNSFHSADIPVLECRVSADRDLSQDYELLNRHLADPLRRVPGVAKVELYGVERPQVQIDFSLDALKRHNLPAGPLLQRIDAANRSLSAGQLRRPEETWPLRVVNQFTSLDDIGRFLVNDRGLKLRDVATVTAREPELDYGRHLDRSRAIGLNVIKESGANTVQVADRARRMLKEIGRDPLMHGIQVLTFTDQGDDIENALRGLLEAGLIGAALATLVLFFFLRNITATLVVSAAIPFSLFATLAMLYFAGRSLNILSMMGLMLAVGMLVDNAVVVLESIYRHRERGMSRLRAALQGSRQVLPAVIASTATSVIVFLPLVLGGRTEVTTWIGEVGRTIIFTLACSLFISVTAIPLAMGRLLPERATTPGHAFAALTRRHRRVLEWTLAHRSLALAIAFVIVVTAVIPFALKVDKSAFSGTQVQSVNVNYEFTDNLNYREVEKYVMRVENWIEQHKQELHVKSTYSYFSATQSFTRAYLAKGYADSEGAQATRKKMREGLPSLPGAKLTLGGDDQSNSQGTRLAVRLFGEAGARLDAVAQDVQRRLEAVPGVTDVTIGGEKGREEVDVIVDRAQASRAGLTAASVGSATAMFFRGRPLARFRGPEGEVEVQARLAAEDRASLERLRELPLQGAEGQVVPLGSVADFRYGKTPASVERQQRHSVLSLHANIDAKRGGEIRKAVTRSLEAMTFPTGYTWSYGEAFEEEDQTQKELLINLLMALVLVYLVMAGLFESLLHPLAIMCALPFAFVGISWISFLTGSPFNLMAQIGLLILIGIVVNNGIVLLYHVHQLRMRGIERTTAILEAGRDRLRPILMTTATTILGLLPLAIGQNRVGDVLYFPLARTVIGGMAASTALTLVLVPCLYTLLEDGSRLLGRVWRHGPRAT